ncbi:MAG TPA: hypothetical protein GX709_01540 [Clostridiales bacterium]|nr:hypothetical protein [Clostridiales bacterium]
MIFTIKKQMYKIDEDYPVKNLFGELVCKIARVKNGYYIYNKLGNQIAQLVFSKDASASLSIVKSEPTFPGAIKIQMIDENNFAFSGNVIEPEDKDYIQNIKGNKKPNNFSVWGKPIDYNYDIYDNSDMIASVITNPADFTEYKIKTTPYSNFLQVLMICLAIEKIIVDPNAKI